VDDFRSEAMKFGEVAQRVMAELAEHYGTDARVLCVGIAVAVENPREKVVQADVQETSARSSGIDGASLFRLAANAWESES
jgi:hypothetical protein